MQSVKHMMTYIIIWKQEKGIFKLTKIRERKGRDLYYIKDIKRNDQRVLPKDKDIKERWREHFSILLNEGYVGRDKNNRGYSISRTYVFSLN